MTNLEKIEGILSGLTLEDAAKLARMLRERWGIREVANIPVVELSIEVEDEPEQEFFDVVLVEVGERRIDVIKKVRALGGYGLKESRELIDQGDAVVLAEVDRETGGVAMGALVELGATVELR